MNDVEGILEAYRGAGPEERLDEYLERRGLRDRFEAIEQDEEREGLLLAVSRQDGSYPGPLNREFFKPRNGPKTG